MRKCRHELTAAPNQSYSCSRTLPSGLESCRFEVLIVEGLLRLRIGGQQHLKAAVEQKTVRFVGSRPSSHVVGRLEDLTRDSRLMQPESATESCQAATNPRPRRNGRSSLLKDIALAATVNSDKKPNMLNTSLFRPELQSRS